MDQIATDTIENEELNKEEYCIHEALSFIKIKSIKYFADVKGQSGIYILWRGQRILYIGCASDLYQGIYSRIAPNGSNNAHFLFDQIDGYTILPLKDYDKHTAQVFRNVLIDNKKPLLNILFRDYNWYNKAAFENFRKKLNVKDDEIKKLRAENEQLKADLDNLISAALKIRKEK